MIRNNDVRDVVRADDFSRSPAISPGATKREHFLIRIYRVVLSPLAIRIIKFCYGRSWRATTLYKRRNPDVNKYRVKTYARVAYWPYKFEGTPRDYERELGWWRRRRLRYGRWYLGNATPPSRGGNRRPHLDDSPPRAPTFLRKSRKFPRTFRPVFRASLSLKLSSLSFQRSPHVACGSASPELPIIVTNYLRDARFVTTRNFLTANSGRSLCGRSERDFLARGLKFILARSLYHIISLPAFHGVARDVVSVAGKKVYF